jgi:hypothetical protein
MDMSTPSTAHALGGADVSGEPMVAPDARDRDEVGDENVMDPSGSANEMPMQFVRFGLPAAIFLWFLVGLVAYGAYRFLAG